MSIAYLNGCFGELDQIRISPLDRGFLFGDGVYEVIPCYGARVFRLEQHLKRLETCLASIQIKNPLSRTAWVELLNDLAKRNNSGDQLLYVQVTRGVAPRDHAFPDTEPTIFAMSRPWNRNEMPVPAKSIVGVDNRWNRCDIKTISLLGNVLLRQQAVENAATENILLRNGHVTEGAASNVFIVVNGEIKTPPRSPFILGGVTRDAALELARARGTRIQECDISEQELRNADEIWLTSSSMEIKPVIELDHARVGGGQPGPVWMEIFAAFRSMTEA